MRGFDATLSALCSMISTCACCGATVHNVPWCTMVAHHALPLLMGCVRGHLQHRDVQHPQSQILQSLEVEAEVFDNKKPADGFRTGGDHIKIKEKIIFTEFWGRNQGNLAYRKVEPYHLITPLHHPHRSWFRPCALHLSKPRATFLHQCYIFLHRPP